MKAIIIWTLRSRKWSIIWWGVGVSMLIFVTLIFYPTIHSQQDQLNKSLSGLSDETVALFSDTKNFFSPVGYLSSQIFYLLLPLILGILSIGLGSSLVGREEKEGTIELLLSRPISRMKLIVAKAATGVLIVSVVGVLAGLLTAGMSKLVGLDAPAWNILLTAIASTLVAVSFGSVAFMVTMLGRGAKSASVGLAALYALGGYIIASLSTNVSWLRVPAKVFVFNYYKSAEILQGTYNWANMLFVIGVIVVCGLISRVAFNKRDLTG
jgi:ABC-2 type transport system permease protein